MRAFGVYDRAGSECVSISRLNTWPARTPVNASPGPLRGPAHDSGPVWLAMPSPYDSFIQHTSPVLIGALGTSYIPPVRHICLADGATRCYTWQALLPWRADSRKKRGG
jgi:hypothetical protein